MLSPTGARKLTLLYCAGMKRNAITATAATLSISLVIIAAGYGGTQWYQQTQTAAASAAFQTQEEAENVYVRFDLEIFDIIMEDYWQVADEAELAELYRRALAKVLNSEDVTLPTPDRAGVAAMLHGAFADRPEAEQRTAAIDIGIVVLTNLGPHGRSGLLSDKQEQELRDTERNVNRDRNLYETLGLNDGASVNEVEVAYANKKAELEAADTEEAAKELQAATYAHEVLVEESTKAVYDEAKIEPTLSTRAINDDTLYADLSQVTPASFTEFVNVLQQVGEEPELTNLVIDLRGNIGGTLDFAKYLWGLFVGPNQYAFDLLRRGEPVVERTPSNVPKIEATDQFDEIAILVDGKTQSTAELVTTIFKKHNRAKVVGTTTRGWGSVENTYPIETQIDPEVSYSVLLVNSLTLREDNQPIESRGAVPHVDITQDDWEASLADEIDSSSLRRAIHEVLAE